MAVEAISAWVDRLLAMPNVDSAPAGALNLANFYGDKADLVQAGPTGSVGIFTFNRPLFQSQLLSLGFGPVADTSYVAKIGAAWETAVNGSTITPSTVTDPAWTASTVDILTSPSASSTITNVSAARSVLEAGLLAAGTPYVANTITSVAENNAQVELYASAWRDATLTFIFLCIGLVAGAPPTPLPKTFPAL